MTDLVNFEVRRAEGEAFLSGLSQEVLRLVYDIPEATTTYRSKADIQRLLPQDMPKSSQGCEAFIEFVRSVFVPNIRTYRHGLHFGHQRPAPSLASEAADMLNGATNTTVSVFEAGPVSVAMESTVQSWLRRLFRLSDDAAVTFTNGGSESTLTALLCARERWEKAYPERDFRDACVLIGTHAHYCVERSARVVGIRPDNILRFPSDERGRASVPALRDLVRQITEKNTPILSIIANSGTTAMGAFDDLQAFRTLADACGAWLHVDASHGGAAIFVRELEDKIAGLNTADSFAWNPHKLMWVSPPCACLFVRVCEDLHLALVKDLDQAHYIVERSQHLNDEISHSENLEWTLACTRQFSALKVFASAFLYGTDATAHRIAAMCKLATALAELVRKDGRFALFCEPEFNIVCFRHIGNTHDPDAFNRDLRARLARQPACYLTGTEIDGAYWLRAQFTSETTNLDHLSLLLDTVDHEARRVQDKTSSKS